MRRGVPGPGGEVTITMTRPTRKSSANKSGFILSVSHSHSVCQSNILIRYQRVLVPVKLFFALILREPTFHPAPVPKSRSESLHPRVLRESGRCHWEQTAC